MAGGVVGVSAGNRLLTTSTTTSDNKHLLPSSHHHHHLALQQQQQHPHHTHKLIINCTPPPPSVGVSNKSSDIEVVLLLHKSILENQWNLSSNTTTTIASSGISARQRRRHTRRTTNSSSVVVASPQLVRNRGGYVIADQLLTHDQVVHLSHIIKAGLSLDHYKSKLKKRLGYEPSDEHLASSLRISRAELHSKRIECSLAREKLVMSNVRLVMSIAKKYDNMGAEMADLVQGGLIGLVRGIEKFDSSKGFKISTYVYWWIRQGISRTLVENSRTLRLPIHLHERLRLIRNAKIKLEDKGITPSTEKIADYLNMSQKKVRNATEAIGKVFSLDKEAFPSLNGLPGETLHSYIADTRLENNPWHGVNELTLKEEVNNLIKTTLREREQDIVRLYYGLDKECLTWEDISRRCPRIHNPRACVGGICSECRRGGTLMMHPANMSFGWRWNRLLYYEDLPTKLLQCLMLILREMTVFVGQLSS